MDHKQKAKILWHCRRGMLELDLILNKFVEKHIDSLQEEQVKTLNDLLSCTDPELYSWLMGTELAPTPELQDLVAFINASN